MKLPAPRWLMQFVHDREGLAAIEFAILAPVMLLIYFGMTEFSQAYMASRRANHMASIAADLIAQSDTTNLADLQRAFDIGDLVLKPFDSAPLSIRITSVMLDKNDRAIVEWSRRDGQGIPALTKGAIFPNLPPDLITEEGQTLIIGESHYVYSSEATRIIQQDLTFHRRYYLKPRTADKITCSDCK